MLRKYFEFVLILTLSIIARIEDLTNINNKKIDDFAIYLNSDCIDSNFINGSVSVCFDYQNINEYLNRYFSSYKIEKISSKEFNLIVKLDRFFNQEIKETYRINKGDNYD